MKVVKYMKNIKKLFFGTYRRGFVVSYFIFLMTGAMLLKLPLSIQDGQSLSWIDAIFVSVSGMSTTGLTTIVVKDVFTVFGQTVLAFILQFGGIGLIMLVSLFWLVCNLVSVKIVRFCCFSNELLATFDVCGGN